ncbi:DMT family transporter [Microbacterium sediminis]|uniref:Multidrug DMT transporter permease n=1 Tax=Microbacterium sediminis TaxID=904291 RepID=A0A1B9NGQ1_9MICO|nr:multidrug DMT transporter permease [Microbacterium sediminis]
MYGGIAPGAADVGEQFVGAFQNPGLLLGIPLALAGAVFMSLGAQFQSRGVRKVETLSGETGETGLGALHLLRLLRRPSWLIGTVLLGFAILCQLSALAVAPLIVVQPLGAVSLVITTLLNAQATGHLPTRKSLTAIGLCVGGIFVFVIVAAMFASERTLSEYELLVVLAILLVVVIVLGGAWALLRKRLSALFYITAAGVLYGFVATLAKVVIKRIQAGDFEWITIVCLVALVAAAVVGGYFVQTAYSSGPPDLVIAGLTVIDPIVAVLIGALVLGEAAHAPLWALFVFVGAGVVASIGVFLLARHHPQVISESQKLGIARGSDGGVDAAARSVESRRAFDQDDAVIRDEPRAASTPLDDLRALRDPDDLLGRRNPPAPGSGDAPR